MDKLVSIIIPCYNEEKTIGLLLSALTRQTYPKELLEVVIADGMSTDRTRVRIQEFQQQHPDLLIRIIDNPQRNIPSGLNGAVLAARGDMIVRLDAHSVPQESYIARCVEALEKNLGDNVGGVWKIQAQNDSWQARSIAAAAAHPLGVGDAQYRYTDQAQLVDTVPFGSFYRSLFERVGLYNETLLTNEDYEFNVRIRLSGGKIWLDPEIRSIYYARSNFLELARQYWRYGYWKAIMIHRYPGTIRWRQALPPVFVLSLLSWLLLSFGFPVARCFLVLELISYTSILLFVGLQSAIKNRDYRLTFGIPMAIATMHLSWGSAFIWSLMTRWRHQNK